MKITWLGHSSFRIETSDAVLLVDPWLDGNPSFPADRRAEAIAGTTHILLSHGHGDHASGALAIARETGAPIACVHELAEMWSNEDGVEVIGYGKGGTLGFGKTRVTMVHAVHSSSVDFTGTLTYAGGEAGLVIRADGRSLYFSGDTDVMMDMELIADRYKPDIGILCAGGHYTMDMEGAAYAAKRFFDFKVLIPCHYKTFPILAQSADDLIAAMPAGVVRTPEVMETVEV